MVIKYRQVALDKVASPDELDQLPRLISPRMVFVVAVILLLVLATVVWGFVGSIPVKIEAMGTFLTRSGVRSIETLYSGEIKEILVKEGDVVEVDQVVAILNQTTLEEAINEDMERLKNLEQQYEEKERFGEEHLRNLKQKAFLDRLSYEMDLEINKRYLTWLEEKRDNQKVLWEKGLDTKGSYIQAKTNYENALNKNKQIKAQLKQLNVEIARQENQLQEQLNKLRRTIEEHRLRLGQKQEKFRRQRAVRSQCRGRVISISAKTGSMLNPGNEILQVEQQNQLTDELICKLYVESQHGSKVEPGMDTLITPFSIETGEYGNVRGFVSRVSTYTVNNAAMRRVLQNELLVQNLTAKGAPYEVTVCLLPDPSTVSGLKWSTKQGAPVEIKAGTLCSANVVIEHKRPVEFVMPFIRKKIFGIQEKSWVEDKEE